MKILNNNVELLDNKDYETIVRKCERAAKTCYDTKPSKDLEISEKFLQKLIKIKHESIIEHEVLSFKITTDRACANQIVRHRVASYSQQSTRYVDLSDFNVVLDQTYTEEEIKRIELICESISKVYKEWGGESRAIRDKVRAILPQCTATQIVMTMNLRELRHFLRLRLAKDAHRSIREVAYQILKIMKEKYPVFVFDFELGDYDDLQISRKL